MEQVQQLRESVDQLTDQVTKLRSEFRRRTVALVVVGAALVAAVGIASRVQAENDRRLEANNARWCPLIAVLTPRPGDAPATTPRGRQISERARVLARDFHCQIGAR